MTGPHARNVDVANSEHVWLSQSNPGTIARVECIVLTSATGGAGDESNRSVDA